jgi:hypothetical protein
VNSYFFHDPSNIWIAVIVAVLVAVACLVTGVLSVYLLLRQFLARHDAIVKRHEELFEKMRLQQDSSDEALRIHSGRIDSIRRRQDSFEEWKSNVVNAMENHERRIKRLEGT